jgi:hypothetical protein
MAKRKRTSKSKHDRQHNGQKNKMNCELMLTYDTPAIDGRNLIFGHKLHIGTPYRGKRFLTRQIPTSCLPKSGGIIGEH